MMRSLKSKKIFGISGLLLVMAIVALFVFADKERIRMNRGVSVLREVALVCGICRTKFSSLYRTFLKKKYRSGHQFRWLGFFFIPLDFAG